MGVYKTNVMLCQSTKVKSRLDCFTTRIIKLLLCLVLPLTKQSLISKLYSKFLIFVFGILTNKVFFYFVNVF